MFAGRHAPGTARLGRTVGAAQSTTGRQVAAHAASAQAPPRKPGKKKPAKRKPASATTAAQQAQSRRAGKRAAEKTQQKALDALSRRGGAEDAQAEAEVSAPSHIDSDKESQGTHAAHDQEPVALPADGPQPADEAPPDVTVVKRRGTAAVAPPPTRTRIPGEIYEHPKYYDWAVAYRDYEMEVDFLFDAYEAIMGDEPLSFLELGAGPAQHSLEMAESKLDVFCVERCAQMVEYSRELAAADDLAVTYLQEDMRDFAMPDGKQVDLAACLLGTFQHLHTLDDGLRAMQRTHAALKPGGLFIVELEHPAHLFDGAMLSQGQTWNLQLDSGRVDVFWGHEGDTFDPFAQVIKKTVAIHIDEPHGALLEVKSVMDYRQYTFQELASLARLSGFEVAAVYEDFDLADRVAYGTDPVPEEVERQRNTKRPPSAPQSDDDQQIRMILVLRKLEADAQEGV